MWHTQFGFPCEGSVYLVLLWSIAVGGYTNSMYSDVTHVTKTLATVFV